MPEVAYKRLLLLRQTGNGVISPNVPKGCIERSTGCVLDQWSRRSISNWRSHSIRKVCYRSAILFFAVQNRIIAG